MLLELHACLKPGGVLFSSNPRGHNEEGWNDALWHLSRFKVLAPLCIVGGLRRTGPLLPSCWLAAGKAALAGKHMASVSAEADASLRSIPIIAVTAYAPSGEEQKARAAGCNDFVPKPYSPHRLLAKIRNYLH